METRRLGRTDLAVSVIGFGGIPIQKLSFDEAGRVLAAALDAGITFFDTARGYTDSEEKMGRALAGRRDALVLATKSLERDPARLAADVDRSLVNLRTDRIDLYQVHNVADDAQLDAVLAPGGVYETLDRARRAGKIRFIGVTGHKRSVLVRAVETGLFDTVQHPFNPIEAEWADDLIPLARRLDVGRIAMKPAAGGAIRDVPAALRWELAGGMDVVIPGMQSLEEVAANAAVGEALREPMPGELAGLMRDKQEWGACFCRRCGYCLPCPEGLNIPFLLLIQAYYARYDLKDWALERLAGLEKRYADCVACGTCVERCPYQLPIPDLMAAATGEVVPV
ncbi:MAG: aldo/keto reductase [Candidatus Krumholzibacteriota bacterium]|nr:aldo/keto reductase [Candidatus Krumholzibacteriota bacterium]